MAQFKMFGLEEIYAYAEKMGFAREDVEIEMPEDLEEEYISVSFGDYYGEWWCWSFDGSLDGVAVDYEHSICED